LNSSTGRYYRKLDAGSSTNWVLLGQLQPPQNALANPDWETVSTGWTASGASYARITTSPAFGIGYASLTPTAASQALTSDAVNISGKYAGLAGQNGLASCRIKVASSAVQHYLEVVTGSGTINSVPITIDTSKYQKTAFNFIWPSSGSAALRLQSGGASGPVAVDDCYLGLADNLQSVAQATMYGSNLYPGTSLCYWSRTNTSFGGFSADTDCASPTPSGYASAPGTKIPAIKFANLPPGEYLFIATGEFYATAGGTAEIANYRFNDGTNSSEASAIQGADASGEIYSTTAIIGRLNYTTAQTNITIEIQCKAQGTASCNINGADTDFSIKVYRFPLATELVQTPADLNWRVDATIAGSNFDLGASDVSSYAEITDGSMTVTQNSGSALVGAVCSSTNQSTVGNLTCAAGSEGFGLTFNVPVAGAYKVCTAFTHFFVPNLPGNQIYSTFQFVETPSNAQTILQEGHDKTSSAVVPSGTSDQYIMPHKNCGTFEFATAGQKTVRLMYEQDVTGTVSSNLLLADQASTVGQRDIHITVEPINGKAQAAPIINSVTSSNVGASRMEWLIFGAGGFTNCTSNPCTKSKFSNSDTWGTVTRSGTGAYSIAIPSGIWSDLPVCTCSASNIGSNDISCTADSQSTTNVTITSHSGGGTGVDAYVQLMCMGPR
jgi:hypothetical protein